MGDGWKQDTHKKHKGFTGLGAGAAHPWLGISVLLNLCRPQRWSRRAADVLRTRKTLAMALVLPLCSVLAWHVNPGTPGLVLCPVEQQPGL